MKLLWVWSEELKGSDIFLYHYANQIFLFPGTLVTIESLSLPLKQLSHPDDCVYVERVGDVIPMAYFLRVFGVQMFDDGGQVPRAPIGSVGKL